MKHVFSALIVAAAFAAAQAQAACNYPVAPGNFPDGSQATKEEMLASKREVEKYNEEIRVYVECSNAEYQAQVAALTKPSKEQLAELARKQGEKEDAAIKEATDVTARFNAQRVIWVEKAKKEKEKATS